MTCFVINIAAQVWNTSQTSGPASKLADVIAADWSADGAEILCGKADGGAVITDASLAPKRQLANVLGDGSPAVTTVAGMVCFELAAVSVEPGHMQMESCLEGIGQRSPHIVFGIFTDTTPGRM
jgi:hypothetical protein